MIVGLLKFPYLQICRHLVALELLSLLEKNGYEISEELAKYISKASECDYSNDYIYITNTISKSIFKNGYKKRIRSGVWEITE